MVRIERNEKPINSNRINIFIIAIFVIAAVLTVIGYLQRKRIYEFFNETKDPTLPRGLRNIGNYCYVNSVIQCLYSIDEFRRLILKNNFEKGTAANFLKNIFSRMEEKQRKIDASEIINILNEKIKKDNFVKNRQEDAHEFFIALMNVLNDEFYQRSKENTNYEDDVIVTEITMTNQHKDEIIKYKKILEDFTSIFYVLFTIHRKYDICGHEIFLESSELGHHYPIENTVSETINKNHGPDESARCNECGSGEPKIFTVNNIVNKFPKYIPIILQRNIFYNKCLKKIDIEKKIKFYGKNYEFHAMIMHSGNLSGGHYTALCPRNGLFYLFNDVNVSIVDSKRLDNYLKASIESYIIFYQKK